MTDDEHGIQAGPVMIYSTRQKEVARFYDELVGLTGDIDEPSIWLKAANTEIVVHGTTDPDTPPEVRGQAGFVVWFGVADVKTAYERAKKAGAVVGDYYGDYFFAKDPDGRFVGVYAMEDHHHDHDR
ncbi:MAG: hypothetical protein M3R54_07075 [Chloroflexota bacterium]|nr:hypothetical protein [Chloroflexota bacterium]